MSEAFQLTIDGDLARRLETAAANAGVARDAYARDLLNQQLFDYDAYTWHGDDPRTTPTSVEETSGTPWSEAEPWLRAQLASLLTEQK